MIDITKHSFCFIIYPLLHEPTFVKVTDCVFQSVLDGEI